MELFSVILLKLFIMDWATNSSVELLKQYNYDLFW